jgi:hypothetical protein
MRYCRWCAACRDRGRTENGWRDAQSQIYLHYQDVGSSISLLERIIFTFESAFTADFLYLQVALVGWARSLS